MMVAVNRNFRACFLMPIVGACVLAHGFVAFAKESPQIAAQPDAPAVDSGVRNEQAMQTAAAALRSTREFMASSADNDPSAMDRVVWRWRHSESGIDFLATDAANGCSALIKYSGGQASLQGWIDMGPSRLASASSKWAHISNLLLNASTDFIALEGVPKISGACAQTGGGRFVAYKRSLRRYSHLYRYVKNIVRGGRFDIEDFKAPSVNAVRSAVEAVSTLRAEGLSFVGAVSFDDARTIILCRPASGFGLIGFEFVAGVDGGEQLLIALEYPA
jgi:hypothetical protein